MSLSDCPHCWETPCACGHEYKTWSVERLDDQIKTLQKVKDKKVNEQQMFLRNQIAALETVLEEQQRIREEAWEETHREDPDHAKLDALQERWRPLPPLEAELAELKSQLIKD